MAEISAFFNKQNNIESIKHKIIDETLFCFSFKARIIKNYDVDILRNEYCLIG